MRIGPLALVLLFYVNVNAQIPNRYVDEVFQDVIESNDIIFSTDVPQPRRDFFNPIVFLGGPPIAVLENSTDPVTLKMDIFEPEGDIASKRPVMILCFGGGFVQGSRDYWSIRLIAQGLARRGYVVASIDYRLGMDLYDKEISPRSVYRAVQDSRSAVRFFKAKAETYRIDTSNIFIGGHSSGAFIALHNVYLDKEHERPDSTYAGYQGSRAFLDLECLDCVGDNRGFKGQAKAAFSLAGAMGDVTYIESAADVPLLMFHSSDDGTVPYDSGEPFASISGFIFGSDLPTVFGSSPIAQRLTELSIDHDFRSYSDRGHDVHENGLLTLHNDILPTIGTWFFDQFLKPVAQPIAGTSALCATQAEQSYALAPNNFAYYDWQISGGSFMSMSNTSDEVEVLWDEGAAAHQLAVKAYLTNGAGAETTFFDVEVVSQATNSWKSTEGGAWGSSSHWDLGRVPLTCEDVVITSTVPGMEVHVEPNTNYQIRSLELNDNVVLKIPASSNFGVGEQ